MILRGVRNLLKRGKEIPHVETVVLLSRKDVYERIKFYVNVEELQKAKKTHRVCIQRPQFCAGSSERNIATLIKGVL